MPSAALRSLIEENAPRLPFCADEKNQARPERKVVALQKKFIQLNPKNRLWVTVFDVDRCDRAGDAWLDAGLPPPTFVAINPATLHAQIGYALATPVSLGGAAHQKPVQYLKAIHRIYTAELGADPAFGGFMSRNPLHPSLVLDEPVPGKLYELGELAEYVDLGGTARQYRPSAEEEAGRGRNCLLHVTLREWAWRAIRAYWSPEGETAWTEAVHRRAVMVNCQIQQPLDVGEMSCVARAIARWTWRHTTPSGFREWQAERGRESGKARRAATADQRAQARVLQAAGHSTRAIALVLQVSQSTISRWLRAP